MTEATNGQSPRPGWRSTFTSYLLGAVFGATVNQITGVDAYRFIAAGLMAIALIATWAWLRRLPPRAPLAQYAPRGMLTASGLAVILTLIGPPSWAPYAILTAAALTSTAVLIPADIPITRRASLLGNLGMTGASVALVGVGVGEIADRNLADGIWHIVIGLAAGAVGLAATIIEFRAKDLGGAGKPKRRHVLIGIGMVGYGVGAIYSGVAAIIGRPFGDIAGRPWGVVGVGLGLFLLGHGTRISGIGNLVPRVRRWLTSLTKDPGHAGQQALDSEQETSTGQPPATQ